MKLSVVIPQYKHYDLLHQCLFDLYKHCRGDIDEVLVVDDGSNDETLEDGLNWWFKQNMLPLKVIWKPENEGFLKTSNLGMKKASGDILVLLSNDVRVNKNSCKEIKDALQRDDKKIIGGRLLDWNTGWNEFGGKIFPYLEGWLIACTKKAWEEIGGFDERYGSSDFEDVHLSTAALQLGYSLVELSDSVAHDHPASSYGYNPKREERTKRNREIFRKIWVDKDETSR